MVSVFTVVCTCFHLLTGSFSRQYRSSSLSSSSEKLSYFSVSPVSQPDLCTHTSTVTLLSFAPYHRYSSKIATFCSISQLQQYCYFLLYITNLQVVQLIFAPDHNYNCIATFCSILEQQDQCYFCTLYHYIVLQ